jgi:dolichyl-phosphate beta-glucosyltransferase
VIETTAFGATAVPPVVPAGVMRHRSISIVIPAYNEERRLPQTLRRIHQYIQEREHDAEILVVDDGSQDRTRDVVTELKREIPTLQVLSNAVNHGKGYAVKQGILSATREAVLFTDADLSTPIEELDRFWTWYDRGSPVVIASRHLGTPPGWIRQPLRRKLMGKVFNAILLMLGVRGIRDTQCGFKLFRTDAGRRIFSRVGTCGFAFDVEALQWARSLGYRISEVGVHWEDVAGSHLSPIRDSIRMLVQVLRIKKLL